MKISTSVFASLCCCLGVWAQTSNTSQLSIGEIMKGDDFVGYLPENIQWSDDSKDILFSWNPDNDTIRSMYKTPITSGAPRKLSFEELKHMPSGGDFTKDYTLKVFEDNGDLFLEDTKTFKVTQITNTLDRESGPQFSGDGKFVIYRLDKNLFAWNVANGSVTQLTDFKDGREPRDKSGDKLSWLENDQLELFEVLRKEKNERDARSYRNGQTAPERPKAIYTDDKRVTYLVSSPDMRYIVYQTVKSAQNKNTIVPNFVTESGYTEDIRARTKVGEELSHYETWIYDRSLQTVYQIKTDDLDGILKKPEFLKLYAKDQADYKELYDKPKEVRIDPPVFSEDGKAILNITSQDNKDRWIVLLNPSDGSIKLLDKQHDEAWIGGPGIGWFSWRQMSWLDAQTVWFKSEETGYSHIYTMNVNTGAKKALTKGNFEILDAELSRDKKTFFITSNKESAHENHFYHLPVKGGEMQKITSLKGGHEVTVSPDEKWLAIRYSYSNKPWELYVMPNKAGATMKQLTSSTTEAFNTYSWRDPEIVRFTARDGAQVPASLYTPDPAKKNGAAVIFVHGAGYLQNVHNWWSSYFREYMFHNFLTDNGYTVLAIDYRASAGYGRDWRTGIYRHMGGKDLDDQIDGVKYLIEQQGIDADKVGIYGGSYGGFITLMALFKYPDTFKSGAALRSVTDWAHYNQGYTANILNTPEEDDIAYKQSSPIYFAEGLKNKLLILHGMVDTNVHFQDVVRLSQRLIELKKENWEMAVFPVENHGFTGTASWTDEYRRIYELFEETLK